MKNIHLQHSCSIFVFRLTVICIDNGSFRSRRFSTNNDVREELRHPRAVRCERAEVRLRPLLQLHQHLLRHRPVQRRRALCCPQLGKTGTDPAAGARTAAGLSALQVDDGRWGGNLTGAGCEIFLFVWHKRRESFQKVFCHHNNFFKKNRRRRTE